MMNITTWLYSSFITHHSSLFLLLRKHRFQIFVDGGGDDARALGVGMEAVLLIQLVAACHAFEEEGDERDLLLFGERLEGVVYLCLVAAAGLARRQHAGEEHADAVRPGARDNLRKVLARLGDRLAAEE